MEFLEDYTKQVYKVYKLATVLQENKNGSIWWEKIRLIQTLRSLIIFLGEINMICPWQGIIVL